MPILKFSKSYNVSSPAPEMSRRKSRSVLEMPVTPLLSTAPDNPFDEDPPDNEDLEGDDSPQTPNTPNNLTTDAFEAEGRRKKRFACAGILVLGLVIVGALIIVAIKQTETHNGTEKFPDMIDRLGRSFETNAASEVGGQGDTNQTPTSEESEESSQETFQSKLTRLMKLVASCHSLLPDKDTCQTVIEIATEDNIDVLISGLDNELRKTKMHKDVETLGNFSAYLEDLSSSNDSLTNPTIMQVLKGLEPVTVKLETPGDARIETVGDIKISESSKPNFTAYDPSLEVHCDPWREKRCRDRSMCYGLAQHCDFVVDCEDNSDEDSCSCVDRLVDDRLCDGYLDCPGGEDEADCSCPGDKAFFCDRQPHQPAECIEAGQVCDGAQDCSNGRDEEDCYILAPSLNLIDRQYASTHGFLSIWNHEANSFYPVYFQEDIIPFEHFDSPLISCNGVQGAAAEVSFVKVSGYSLPVWTSKDNINLAIDSISDSEEHSFVFVDCGQKTCGTNHKRSKRSDTLHPLCEQLMANMTREEQEEFRVKNATLYHNGCDKCNDPTLSDEAKQNCLAMEGKIVGGEVSYPKSWPYTVSISRDGTFICGGTILSPEWVITAGHCVYGYEEGYFFTVRAGMIRRQSQAPWEQHRHVSEVFIHPNYDNIYLRHDVALIRLNEPLSVNSHAQEVCLPHDSDMFPTSGSTCIAAGWGDLSENGPSSEQLRHVEVPILSRCGHSYNDILYQVCGGFQEGGKDACQGDSGGPLYCRDNEDNWYLGGVISHGKGCARKDEAGVYTKVSYYLDWLHMIMRGDVVSPGIPGLECEGLMCGSGECVPADWVCDTTVDCLDGGDVRNCVTLANGTRVQLVQEEVEETLIHQENDVKETIFEINEVECDEEEFKCESLEQCIPLTARCDGSRDCPDWSDESDCLCGDSLPETRLCDDVRDCRDGSDEDNCDLCQPEEYRCTLSQKCIPRSSVCDTVYDCEFEEDERFCTALTTNSFLSVSTSGDPLAQNQGILLLRQEGSWLPVCVSEMSFGLASTICSYMGYHVESYKLVDPGQLPSKVITLEFARAAGCRNVEMECDNTRCGHRPLYRNLRDDKIIPSQGEGSWPWQASFFVEGHYMCGGSIVHKRFVLTELGCAQLLVSSGHYITVLVGQDRRTMVGFSPSSQTRRVVSLKVTSNSNVVLAQVSEQFVFNEYVNNLCLEDFTSNVNVRECFISGASHSSYANTMPVIVKNCSEGFCIEEIGIHGEQPLNWAGVLACEDRLGVFQGVGVFSIHNFMATSLYTPFNDVLSLSIVMENDTASNELPDYCEGFRCALGQCVEGERVCDRHWDCPEGEDEAACPYSPATSLPVCSPLPEPQLGLCSCPVGTGRCDNNLCVDTSLWCNGVSECGDMSDEPARCATCPGLLGLTQPGLVCDGEGHCQDLEDETPEACGCPDNSWRCDQVGGNATGGDRGECIELTSLCDGHPDCTNGEDEDPSHCIALSPVDDIHQNALLIPDRMNFGYLKVRTYGIWYNYCADDWSDMEASTICEVLGFSDHSDWILGEAEMGTHLHTSHESSSVSCSKIQLNCGPTQSPHSFHREAR